jgi:putative nucleotidyltransferase with HDIG domain
MSIETSHAAAALTTLIEQGQDAQRSGDWNAALASFEAAFRRLPQQGSAAQAAQLLRWIGTVHRERGDIDVARELYDASLEVAERNGLADQIAAGLNLIAAIEQFSGEPDTAEALYGRAKQIATESGDDRMQAMVDQNLGALANMRGDVPAALYRYTSALLRYRRVGDLHSAVGALNNMGMAHIDLGELDAASTCLDQALELATAAQDPLLLGYVQANRAELYLKRQQFEDARQCCDDSFSIFTQLQSKTGLAEVYKFYGMLYRETGKAHLSDIHLGLAWNLANQAQNRLLQAEVQHELARVHLEEQRNIDAIGCLNRAHRLFHEMQARRDLLDIENQLDELERTYLRVVEQWGVETIETKDPYTHGHSQRVADLACALAECVGVNGRDLTWLRIGALLHDVGKTVVPGSVLVKPGVLNETEWGMMKQHTLLGDEIVAGLDLPYDLRPVVRNHHERWDGQGYPDRLAGEQIPFFARILSVADVFDALTSKRSYRSAFSTGEAHRILGHQAGRALDPQLVERFQRLVA